jgi:zinc protease
MPDRKKGPGIQPIPDVTFAPFLSYELTNGLKVYQLQGNTPGLCKIDAVFFAGRPFETKKSVARACSLLIKEGTSDKNSAYINEFFDYHGSTLGYFSTMDQGGLTLISLSRYLEKMLPTFVELLTEPHFSEEELRKFKKNAKEKIKDDLSRNDVIAYRQVTLDLYGESHPYGYNSTIESIEALEREDLLTHFHQTFTAANGFLIVSGDLPNHFHSLLEKYFSPLPKGKVCRPEIPLLPAQSPAFKEISGANDLQFSLRMAKPILKRGHPDYPGIVLLDQLLGGYFGSRLMSNLREDKGLTYNIYSNIEIMYFDSYWMISTETSNENIDTCLREIAKEIEILGNSLVSPDELTMARNYLLGNLITSLDSTFSMASLMRNLLCEGGDFELLEQVIQEINLLQPKDLQLLAQKHLQPETFHTIVVGTKEK